jgi:hypothetical protein
MRNKLVIIGALAATAAIGVGIGVAQGAASSANANTRPARVSVRPATTPFKGSAQTMFAVVSASGLLARGYGVAASGPIGTMPGTYEVLFKRGVAKCAYTATLGVTGSTGAPPPGEIGVAGLNGHQAGVWVRTYDSAGTMTAASFHLVVACPPL